MTRVDSISGIGPAYQEMLRTAGVRSVESLLKLGATPAGRKGIAARSGVPDTLVLEWVNHADLCRVKGIGPEYANLLEAAGVDTVPELAQRNPTNLTETLAEVNAEKMLVLRLPVESQVKDWVEQAKQLGRVIRY